MKPMVYLATAYSHKGWLGIGGKFMMWLRNRRVTLVAAKVMTRGYNCFSPITHSHIIATVGKLPALDHEFWLALDAWYVDRCDQVWVYNQPGWRESTGVNREMDWAWEQGKPVLLVDKDATVIDAFGSREHMELVMQDNY